MPVYVSGQSTSHLLSSWCVCVYLTANWWQQRQRPRRQPPDKAKRQQVSIEVEQKGETGMEFEFFLLSAADGRELLSL